MPLIQIVDERPAGRPATGGLLSVLPLSSTFNTELKNKRTRHRLSANLYWVTYVESVVQAIVPSFSFNGQNQQSASRPEQIAETIWAAYVLNDGCPLCPDSRCGPWTREDCEGWLPEVPSSWGTRSPACNDRSHGFTWDQNAPAAALNRRIYLLRHCDWCGSSGLPRTENRLFRSWCGPWIPSAIWVTAERPAPRIKCQHITFPYCICNNLEIVPR